VPAGPWGNGPDERRSAPWGPNRDGPLAPGLPGGRRPARDGGETPLRRRPGTCPACRQLRAARRQGPLPEGIIWRRTATPPSPTRPRWPLPAVAAARHHPIPPCSTRGRFRRPDGVPGAGQHAIGPEKPACNPRLRRLYSCGTSTVARQGSLRAETMTRVSRAIPPLLATGSPWTSAARALSLTLLLTSP
jgi:hypothetical protein